MERNGWESASKNCQVAHGAYLSPNPADAAENNNGVDVPVNPAISLGYNGEMTSPRSDKDVMTELMNVALEVLELTSLEELYALIRRNRRGCEGKLQLSPSFKNRTETFCEWVLQTWPDKSQAADFLYDNNLESVAVLIRVLHLKSLDSLEALGHQLEGLQKTLLSWGIPTSPHYKPSELFQREDIAETFERSEQMMLPELDRPEDVSMGTFRWRNRLTPATKSSHFESNRESATAGSEEKNELRIALKKLFEFTLSLAVSDIIEVSLPDDRITAVVDTLEHFRLHFSEVIDALWALRRHSLRLIGTILRRSTFNRPEKLIADAVHGSLAFPAWIMEHIVDTRPVQRLKNLLQLGTTVHVYPAATHTRFAHSLGVGSLASKWWDQLTRAAGVEPCRETDLVAEDLMIAGICHDLGHGPFSHMFELFVRNYCGLDWHHEDMSLVLLERLINEKEASEFLTDDRIKTIRNMIRGVPISSKPAFGDEVTNLQNARYQIVANTATGIDVDRFDYLQRDALISPDLPRFSPSRMIRLSRVIDGIIHFHEKEKPYVINLYSCRRQMFDRVYVHRKVLGAEFMICDMLEHRAGFTDLKQQILDADEFLSLDDTIIRSFPSNEREFSVDEREHLRNYFLCSPRKLVVNAKYAHTGNFRAKELYQRYQRRDFYKFCGMFDFKGTMNPARQREYTAMHLAKFLPSDSTVRQSDLIFGWRQLDYGTGEKSPMQNVAFYDPWEGSLASTGDTPFQTDWRISTLRIYCREKKHQREVATACELWRASIPQQELSHSLVGSSQCGPQTSPSSTLGRRSGMAPGSPSTGTHVYRGMRSPKTDALALHASSHGASSGHGCTLKERAADDTLAGGQLPEEQLAEDRLAAAVKQQKTHFRFPISE